MADRSHLDLDFASALASGYDTDDFPAVQPDAHGQMAMFELHHMAGFMSMPTDPSSDGTAQSLLYGTKGPDGFAWLLNDPRLQSKLPQVKPGESFQYGPTGNCVRCHDDGTVSVFTTDQGPKQQSVYFQVKPSAFRTIAPWGSIQFDANGYHLKHVSQARIDLGAIGGLPAPLSALSSYVTLSASTINLQGTFVALGSPSGVPEPAAKASASLVALNALAFALDGVADALAGIASVPVVSVNTAATGAITAAGVAIVAAHTAVAAAALTIPSASVTVT